ncbi:uncharacterized protein PSFLO_06756 [Pseudozyma flocculosa]|uniref:Uncharacterized protein n=1 Tax=Pseudozyma flocculosa TaxID=84751 RepID=A0A5C3FA30_9BASI|nr:uncharacterized protein PSFLO_06756 [Pseudozyma flocculosa]
MPVVHATDRLELRFMTNGTSLAARRDAQSKAWGGLEWGATRVARVQGRGSWNMWALCCPSGGSSCGTTTMLDGERRRKLAPGRSSERYPYLASPTPGARRWAIARCGPAVSGRKSSIGLASMVRTGASRAREARVCLGRNYPALARSFRLH